MEIHSKSDINAILKKHKYGSIESDRLSKNKMTNLPYRDFNDKIIKGISLFRTSPVTFTNAGRERGAEKVGLLLDDIREIGQVSRLSEFGFVAVVLTGKNKCVKVVGSLDSRDGLEYDQTFHFLSIEMTEQKLSQTDITSYKPYTDKETEVYSLTNEYLDKILSR
jgi:hypothetical protein